MPLSLMYRDRDCASKHRLAGIIPSQQQARIDMIYDIYVLTDIFLLHINMYICIQRKLFSCSHILCCAGGSKRQRQHCYHFFVKLYIFCNKYLDSRNPVKKTIRLHLSVTETPLNVLGWIIIIREYGYPLGEECWHH